MVTYKSPRNLDQEQLLYFHLILIFKKENQLNNKNRILKNYLKEDLKNFRTKLKNLKLLTIEINFQKLLRVRTNKYQVKVLRIIF